MKLPCSQHSPCIFMYVSCSGLQSFGFGGTNAHTICKHAVQPDDSWKALLRITLLLRLSRQLNMFSRPQRYVRALSHVMGCQSCWASNIRLQCYRHSNIYNSTDVKTACTCQCYASTALGAGAVTVHIWSSYNRGSCGPQSQDCVTTLKETRHRQESEAIPVASSLWRAGAGKASRRLRKRTG